MAGYPVIRVGQVQRCLQDKYRDPEIKDEHLTLYIRQPRYGADIMAGIEHLSDAFSDQLEHASGYLLLTTDFSSPRGSDVV